jgi:hypothetical protein
MSPPDGTANHVSSNYQNSNTRPMKHQQEDVLEPTVHDHVPTGTKAILESPHVSDGPGKIANSPVPSVFVSSISSDNGNDDKQFHFARAENIYNNMSFS